MRWIGLIHQIPLVAHILALMTHDDLQLPFLIELKI
jgi:hypothetical protein